jgi:two-component system LytT family response regulator
MKIKCVIVEDEPKAMKLMEEHVRRTPFLSLSAVFHEPLAAVNFLSMDPQTELVFLDINLPEMSGIDIARILHPRIKVIFTTAYSDFAVKSYELNTIDYLLKPISYHRFYQAASKTKTICESETRNETATQPQSHFFVKSGKKIIRINWSDIFYIEAMREYISIVTAEQRMTEFENSQPNSFKRIHNSYIINLDKIEKVEDNLIQINGREFPISKSYKEEFYSTIKGRLI